jgi:hypothetical protein
VNKVRVTIENAGKAAAVIALGFIAGAFAYVAWAVLERSGN